MTVSAEKLAREYEQDTVRRVARLFSDSHTEVKTRSGARCDIVAGLRAIEVEPMHSWERGLGQCLAYAYELRRYPGLVIVCTRLERGREAFARCRRGCMFAGVRLWAFDPTVDTLWSAWQPEPRMEHWLYVECDGGSGEELFG